VREIRLPIHLYLSQPIRSHTLLHSIEQQSSMGRSTVRIEGKKEG
jgi:hypothetical protein